MKKIFIALAALATIAACNKADVIETQEGEQIAFGNAFVENSTKAATLGATAQEFTEFNVWGTVGGVPIYKGALVEGTVGSKIENYMETHVWTCTTVKQYWIKDAQYKFSALANEGTVTLGVDNLPEKTTVDATYANVDLLYATPVTQTGKSSGNAPVEFTFNHLLSKVKFSVQNSSQSATGYSFDVRDITITCPKTGTIILATEKWEGLGEADEYDLGTVTVNNSTASAEFANELLLIPGSVSINYVVDIKCGDTTIVTHELDEPYTTEIKGGNSYNFIVSVSVGEEITFSVDKDAAWIPAA